MVGLPSPRPDHRRLRLVTVASPDASEANGFESDSLVAELGLQAAREAATRIAAMGAKRRAVTAVLRRVRD